jgi:hypothetical protein
MFGFIKTIIKIKLMIIGLMLFCGLLRKCMTNTVIKDIKKYPMLLLHLNPFNLDDDETPPSYRINCLYTDFNSIWFAG